MITNCVFFRLRRRNPACVPYRTSSIRMVTRLENSHDARSRSAAAASPLGPVPAGVLRRIRPVARLLSPCEGAAGVVPPSFPQLLLIASSRAREGQRLGRPARRAPGSPPAARPFVGTLRHPPTCKPRRRPTSGPAVLRSLHSICVHRSRPRNRPVRNRYAPACARTVPHRQPTAKPLRLLARPRSSRPRSASRLSHLRSPRRAARARYGPRATPTVLVAVTASSKGPAARAPLHPSTLPVSVPTSRGGPSGSSSLPGAIDPDPPAPCRGRNRPEGADRPWHAPPGPYWPIPPGPPAARARVHPAPPTLVPRRLPAARPCPVPPSCSESSLVPLFRAAARKTGHAAIAPALSQPPLCPDLPSAPILRQRPRPRREVSCPVSRGLGATARPRAPPA